MNETLTLSNFVWLLTLPVAAILLIAAAVYRLKARRRARLFPRKEDAAAAPAQETDTPSKRVTTNQRAENPSHDTTNHIKKEDTMDYLHLFNDTDLLDGGDNFRCTYYRLGGQTELIGRNNYPMLFVLQGAVEMHLKRSDYRVEAGNFVVIDKTALSDFRTEPSTIVLTYRPPKRLQDFLIQWSSIYDKPISEMVPILPTLQVWIDALLEQHLQGVSWEGEAAHEQRKELAHIFMDYPPRAIGDLRAPFSVCVIGGCEYCQQEVFATCDQKA